MNEEIKDLFNWSDNREEIQYSKKKSDYNNIFNIFNKITKQQPITHEEISELSDYMLLTWFSNHKDTIEVAKELNDKDIPITNMIMVMKSLLKERGIKFIKFAPRKKKKYSIKPEIKKYIQLELNLNDEKFEDIEDMIDKDFISYIKRKYQIN